MERLRRLAPGFHELCAELAAFGLPTTVQHDDLHQNNAFVDGDGFRIIDWGDSSRSHPFVSLVVPFRFLEKQHGLPHRTIRSTRGSATPTSSRGETGLLPRHLSGEERANLEPGFQVVLRRALERF